MIQVLLSSSVTLETLPGAVKADPITVDFAMSHWQGPE